MASAPFPLKLAHRRRFFILRFDLLLTACVSFSTGQKNPGADCQLASRAAAHLNLDKRQKVNDGKQHGCRQGGHQLFFLLISVQKNENTAQTEQLLARQIDR